MSETYLERCLQEAIADENKLGGDDCKDERLRLEAELRAKADGAFDCPICGRDTPHTHSPEEVIKYRNGTEPTP